MKSASINKSMGTQRDSWLSTVSALLRSAITMPNLVAILGGLLAVAFLLALPDPWNIRIPLYLTILIWTLLQPRAALYLIAFAVPWGSLDYIDVKGLRLNSADLLVAFLAAGWLMSFVLRPGQFCTTNEQDAQDGPSGRGPSGVPVYLGLSIVALITVMLLSLLVATDTSASLKEISKWLEFLVLLLLGAQYVRTRRQLWTIIVLICIAAITQAVYGYVQAVFDIGPLAFVKDTSLRIYGTFDQPNPYAGYINIPLSITLALTLLGSNWKTRILAGITSVLLGAAEYLTQSRGGEIAIAAALIFIVAIGSPRLNITFKLLALGAWGTVAAFLMDGIPIYILTPILTKLGLNGISLSMPTNQTFSTAERLAHWIAGLNMFFDHPILGVGIGNYAAAYPHYIVTIFTDPLGHAHNYYINVAAEMGALGLSVYLLFLLATFVAGAHAYRSVNTKYKQARAHTALPQTPFQKPEGTRAKLGSLVRSLGIAQYQQQQKQHQVATLLANDRVLAIGLLAALVSVCMHNVFDDLYVHSLTNLIALLLIALIRLEGVTL